MTLARRSVALGALGLVNTAAAATHAPSAAADWNEFRARFITPEGRVVDTANRNASHSEGQAYALLAALAAQDAASFARILAWTNENLRRRTDTLHSWRWQPDSSPPVTDPNNATDGDLCIAWALVEAGQRWDNAVYYRRGIAMARDLIRFCTARVRDRLILLPAAYGFQARGRTVVNLSYYVFPAIRALGAATRDTAWAQIEADGIALLREARFGRWSLPPDWLEIRHENGTVVPAPGWPPRFSFDAIRVPMNMAWGGLAQEPTVAGCLSFWHSPDFRALPAWCDLRTGYVAPYPANSGIVAVARLSPAAKAGRGDLNRMPRVIGAPDYYAAALVMLSRMAWRDLSLR